MSSALFVSRHLDEICLSCSALKHLHTSQGTLTPFEFCNNSLLVMTNMHEKALYNLKSRVKHKYFESKRVTVSKNLLTL